MNLSICAQSTDSISQSLKFRGTASCSVTGQQNWQGSSQGAIALSAGVDLKYRLQQGSRYANHHFRGDLGYMQPSGEQWLKNYDQFLLSMIWFNAIKPGWKSGFSGRLSSQWLPTMKPDFETGKETYYGGFMNPFTLDCAYDFSRSFMKNSRVMVSIATLSVYAIPPKCYFGNMEEIMIKTNDVYIRSRYGCSVQLIIDETFHDNSILLDNRSVLVANSLSRDGIRMDIQNRISFKLIKYIQLRLDSRVLYDPLYSYKLQFRQEVLLGFFYNADW